jgi:endonuclease-3 related protein
MFFGIKMDLKCTGNSLFMSTKEVYKILLNHFGGQNWWPMKHNFRPREWEICVGAILTQNTSWINVEKALNDLSKKTIVTPQSVIEADIKELEKAVRSSGFYKQKAARLKTLAEFVLSFNKFEHFRKSVERIDLLKVNGIGRETADSILLYACGKPYFVVDAYTKRIFSRLDVIKNTDYENVREYFEKDLPRDVDLYKEFHALIVELGKNYCRKKPLCKKCPLTKTCPKIILS